MAYRNQQYHNLIKTTHQTLYTAEYLDINIQIVNQDWERSSA